MKKIKLLFVISNISIGGPQKSLLALLDKIDYDVFDVSIYVLKPGGKLRDYFNKNARFLNTVDIITAATLPSENTIKYLKVFLKQRKFKMLSSALNSILNHIILQKNMNQQRQKFWNKFKNDLPKLEEQFDLAFGILGLSTYFVIDVVDATKKFHWIRSDTRILNRDIEIDADYYKKLNGALSVSLECAKIFEEMYPFMKRRIDVYYNHIPLSFYEKLDYDNSFMDTDDNFIKILTVTRLDPLKGIDLAIEACRILVQRGFKIKWLVLGGGKFRRQIEKLIIENRIQDSFILLGFQLNTLAFIKDTDIFVHSSRTEGKSNAVDEAKYVGKPIVVTNYDTVGEQIENNLTGLICRMSGVEIADSIEKIIRDSELRNMLIKNCKSHQDGTLEVTEFFSNLLADRRI